MPPLDVAVDCPVYRFVPRPASGGNVRRAVGAAGRRSGSASNARRAATPKTWRIGLIVGPSGSGKSTIARAMFADRVYRRGVAAGPGGHRRPGRPADQGDHRPVHGRGVQLAAELGQAVPRAQQRGAVPLRPGPALAQCDATRVAGRVRRIHQRGGPQRGAGGVGGDRQGAARRADRRAVRGRHLPLRRDRVAPAGLGHRHGHLDVHAEVSSTTADRACNLSLPARCVAVVCASSLSERRAEHGGPLLPGPVGGQPGGVLRDRVADRAERTAGGSAASSRCPTTRASASAWPWPRRWPSCTAAKATA